MLETCGLRIQFLTQNCDLCNNDDEIGVKKKKEENTYFI